MLHYLVFSKKAYVSILASQTSKVRRAHRIRRTFQNNFSTPRWGDLQRTPFPTLIRTVLSQATTSRSAARAFENLSHNFSITPEALVKANVKDVEEAIKVAGLYRDKSKVIKSTSQAILKRFDSSLDFIYTAPLEEARRMLLTMAGGGPKTADVTLLFLRQETDNSH